MSAVQASPAASTTFLRFCFMFIILVGDGCWVLGVDEVLVGQKLRYYIGLIRLIGLSIGVTAVLII